MRSFFFPRGMRRTPRLFTGLQILEDRSVPASFSAEAPQSFGTLNNNNGQVSTGDFNKDGNLDIVLSNYGSSKDGILGPDDPGNRITVLYGKGNGTFGDGINYASGGSSKDFVSFTAVADLNGDSWLDIISVQTGTTSAGSNSTMTVYQNTTLGNFVAKPAVSTGGKNATWVGIADFNDDTIPDVAITHMGEPVDPDVINGNNISTYSGIDDGNGKGSGTFTLTNQLTTTFEFVPTSAVIVDITGDSKPDIVATIATADPESTISQTNGKLGLVTNDGFGTLTIGGTFPSTGGPLPISIAAADFNNDGVADLVIANAGDPDNKNFYANFGAGTKMTRLLGDGFGGFASPLVMTSGIRCAFGVTTGDFNFDNKQDIALASYGRPLGLDENLQLIPAEPGALVVYLGNGTGSFSIDTGSPYTDSTEGNQSAAVGQFNNSGGLDVITIGDHNRVRTHLNIATANTPPTISDIGNVIGSAGTTTSPIAFTIGDVETPVASLTLTKGSSNTTVMPLANITFGGSGANRTVSLQVPTGASGSSVITVTVTDGSGVMTSDTFTISVGANTNPGISDIADVKVTAGSSVGPINFLIGDNESLAGKLTLKASSSNPALIPSGAVTFGGTDSVRSVSFPTIAGFAGSTTLTVTVTDEGGLTASDSFVVTQTLGAVVSSISTTSGNGTYTTGQSINVTLNFSESVTLAGGNLLVTLDSGATVVVTPFAGTSAAVTYVVGAGQTSPDLNVTALSLSGGATFTNGGGAAVNLGLPANNLATSANLIVNPPPPTTVNFITVNDGSVQRSRITSLTLNFNNPVNAATFTAAGAITLTRTAATKVGTVGTLVQTGASTGNGLITIAPASGMVTSITLTFSNAGGASTSAGVENGSLSDGRWQLAIPSLGYTSPLNGTNLRRLFGDGDGNGFIDGSDFALFGSDFNTSSPTFDFDNTLAVDSVDLAQFGNRYGLTL